MRNIKIILLALAMGLAFIASSANAAITTVSATEPTVDGEDIANYGGAIGTDKWWPEANKATGYPKGQTFTTGSQPVWLNSLTYEIADNQSAEPTKNYIIRVGTVYGTVFTDIYNETAVQGTGIQWIGATKAAGLGVDANPFMTWSFDSPVLLAPNTEYGIDVGLTSSTSGWTTGIPYLNYTDNTYSGGTRYMSGTAGMGIGDDTMNNMSGDYVFHVDLSVATGTPGYAYPQNGGTVPGGDLDLAWTNLAPDVGSDVWVDVWFGTDPDTDFTKIVDKGLNAETYTVALPGDGTYYWRIDSYLNGSSSGTPVEGSLITFYVDETTELSTIAAMVALKNHILSSPALTAEQIAAHSATIDANKTLLGRSYDVIAAAFDLVETYDATPRDGSFGPMWIDSHPPSLDTFTDNLTCTMYTVMQAIMDNTYNSENVALYEALLDGFIFGSSEIFPGPVDPPAVITTHTAAINASYPDTSGWERLGDTLPARKPTGTYVAPGSIVTVTVPPALVDAGYAIRVGAHSWDLSRRSNASTKRLERCTVLYPIDSTTMKVANPLGGGIYIEVPYRADGGVVNIDITGAVRSPYFSMKSFHTTTLEQWRNTERHHPAPWADFQTDKYMCQVPTSWIYALDDPSAGLNDWDAAIDTFNDLMGFPRDRGKETFYLQLDVINRSSVFAPGYPAVNTHDSNPTASGNGNSSSHLVRGPNTNIWISEIEFHEQGHGYFFPKFGGESESNVNLPYVAVMNKAFGHDLDYSFAASLNMQNNPYKTLDNTAVTWMTVFSFSPRDREMQTGEKAYQLKGHAKFVDIAKLFGWQVLNDYWKSFVDDYENGLSINTSDDEKMLRLAKAVGVDTTPLLYFWGIHPSDPNAMKAAVAAEGLLPSSKIYDRLQYYKSLVPANNAEFQAFALNWWGRKPSIDGNWTEREHARQWDETPLYGDTERRPNGEIYVEASAADIRDRVQEIIDMYFSDGSPAYSVQLNDMVSWSGAPMVMDPNIVNNAGASMNYSWSANPAEGVSFDATDIANPTVTITKPAGDMAVYTLELMIDDGVNIPASDSMTVDVYDNACQATRLGLGMTDESDLNGDCLINLADFAVLADKWLTTSGLQSPQHK